MNLILFLFLLIKFSSEKQTTKQCGYESCHPTKDGYVNLHLIAHTHDDVGWVKTVDQYYEDYVKTILQSVFESLQKDHNRRFIYVESAFLFKWWKDQDNVTKKAFKKLINTGQLELVSGAWSMNDEATTHYQSIIDQFTLGLTSINKVFGKCGRPKVGWQIDPFGHSREMASIFAQLGFDGLFLGRIDYQDKYHRFYMKSAEMLWNASSNLGKQAEIFTHILYNAYWPPENLCFDVNCMNDNIHPERYWKILTKHVNAQLRTYKTKNVIFTMGNDFHYTDAEAWFKNLDAMIGHANALQDLGSKLNIIYSTPSCYLKAVRDEALKSNITWPMKTDDFFPYASNQVSYWTGFYTSRPTLKRFERMGNNYLQVCKQLYVLSGLNSTYEAKLRPLKEAMGVLQHHDAISGTEQQHVAQDYAKLLYKGFQDCLDIASTSLNILSWHTLTGRKNPLSFTNCLLTNISQCELTEDSEKFVITVYNPLSRFIDHYVRIPVLPGEYLVADYERELPVQLVPIPTTVLQIPGRNSDATFDLVFKAQELPPLGFKTYYVTKVRKPKAGGNITKSKLKQKSYARLLRRDGFLNRIVINGESIPIRQNFLYYDGSDGFSGAYLFLTNRQPIRVTEKVTNEFHFGDVVKEIHQTFNSWVSQIIRIYPDESFVEFNWVVGPLPDLRLHSTDVISRFTTFLNTNATFYTDSNGREMIERVRNKRASWNITEVHPISGNYYPVTTRISMRDRDKDLEVAILTDRAQGGASLNDGQIDLMVHRNSMYDDALGVEERLDEYAFGRPLVARGSHYVVAGPYLNPSNESIASIAKDISQRKLLEAWTFLSETSLSYTSYKKRFKMKYSGLKRALPRNVQILTLEPLDNRKILLRLEHIFEIGEDPIFSKTVEINLEDLFRAFRLIKIKETTLGGNQWLNDNKRMNFDPHSRRSFTKNVHARSSSTNNFIVSLDPMEIRTFVVWIKPSKKTL